MNADLVIDFVFIFRLEKLVIQALQQQVLHCEYHNTATGPQEVSGNYYTYLAYAIKMKYLCYKRGSLYVCKDIDGGELLKYSMKYLLKAILFTCSWR